MNDSYEAKGPKGRGSNSIPSLKGWGGVKHVVNKIERSQTIVANKEAVAYSLLTMANTKITDIFEWDDMGNVRVKASSKIPEHALQSIKSVKSRVDKDGSATIELELYDKVQVLRILAKASGLLDTPDDGQKPSVIGVNIQAPEDVEIKDEAHSRPDFE
jgi:hypothetical protein